MIIWVFPVSILITTFQQSHFLPLSAMFCPFLSQMITFYHISQLSLFPLSHDKAFCQQGPRRMYWASLSIFISPPLHFVHIMNSSACLFKSGTVCWLSGWMRKLSDLASVNGELFIHYKRLLLACSKSKAVFGDIVLLLPLLFTEHLVFEIQVLKSGIFRKKCQLCCSGALVL